MECSPKRLYLRNFLPASTCKELEFIHKSCGVAGYRPSVLSTTLLHLIATNCSSLIMPLIPIREKVKELVEEHYGCEYELFIEFTGLISWVKGARIGWHSDNGRTYLKQRHFTAVCYLNSNALDFQGGLFHFQEGLQTTIIPQIGDVLIYRAEDMHSVDEVTHGERCTLALWFTLDSSCDEDAKILDCLNLSPMKSPVRGVNISSIDSCYPDSEAAWMPLPASNSMYIVNSADESKQHESKRTERSTFQSDLRVARAGALGFEFCMAVDGVFATLGEMGGQPNKKDALEGPMKLKSDGKVVPCVFANSIHALQVLYFCKWKQSEQQDAEMGTNILEQNEVEKLSVRRLANTQISLFGGKVSIIDNNDNRHACGGAVNETVTKKLREKVLHSKDWEQYMVAYHKELQRCLPVWKHFRCISAHVSQDQRTPDN